MEKTLTFNDYVRLSIDSGVPPLELFYFPIIDYDQGFPLAYRTSTNINSITLGTLPEEEYTYVGDKRPCGVELLKHNLQHMITAYRKFEKAKRNVAFLSVRCPAEIVENPDVELFEIMRDVLQKNPTLDPTKLCIEFPAGLMEKNTEKARTTILDMKVLKVRTMLTGCGKEDFPLSKLVTVPPDLVVLDPSATAWAGSRNKPQLIPSLVSYIKSMGVDVIAEGTEKERRAMRNAECFGFLMSGGNPLSLQEAIAQREEDEA